MVKKKNLGRGGVRHALIYLTKDNDSWEACVWIIWNSWMEDEDAYKMGFEEAILIYIKKQKILSHVFSPPLKLYV